MASEQSPLVELADELYQTYDMDGLPPELQRDSRYYYYLSVYPGLKKMDELEGEELPKLPDSVHNAYIHTPYCTGVCDFCSYFLTTVGEDDRSPVVDYLEVVKQEVSQRARETNLDLSYLYFGGGTPSLIPTPALESFFDFLNKNQVLSESRFGTLELHPEFFSDLRKAQEFINVLKANGVGRVSVGFQSSDEAILGETNRRHGTTFLKDAIEFLKQSEMLVNLDLIYGLPGLSLKQWERTLEDATACDPDSISTYFLFVNPGTVMHTQVQRGEVILPSHQEIQTQHIMAQVCLEGKGYHELPSDFFAKVEDDPDTFTQDALPSQSASLPLGAGSYGYYDNTQFFNQFSLAGYRQRIQAGESPIWSGHRFEGLEGLHRDMMFSLKNSPHINRKLFVDKYGIDPVDHFPEQFSMLGRYGLIELDDTKRRAALTAKGRLCVEEVCCVFEIPDLADKVSAASRSDKKRLDKHNFVPLYGLKREQ